MLHNTQGHIAIVLLVDELFFGNEPFTLPVPITGLHPMTAAHSLHGLATLDFNLNHFGFQVVVLQRRDFLDPICAAG